jgi:hypothetical protein
MTLLTNDCTASSDDRVRGGGDTAEVWSLLSAVVSPDRDDFRGNARYRILGDWERACRDDNGCHWCDDDSLVGEEESIIVSKDENTSGSAIPPAERVDLAGDDIGA